MRGRMVLAVLFGFGLAALLNGVGLGGQIDSDLPDLTGIDQRERVSASTTASTQTPEVNVVGYMPTEWR